MALTWVSLIPIEIYLIYQVSQGCIWLIFSYMAFDQKVKWYFTDLKAIFRWIRILIHYISNISILPLTTLPHWYSDIFSLVRETLFSFSLGFNDLNLVLLIHQILSKSTNTRPSKPPQWNPELKNCVPIPPKTQNLAFQLFVFCRVIYMILFET